MAPPFPLVPHLIHGLADLGISRQRIARLLGCSPSHVSRLGTGERALSLEDYCSLLSRLRREFPALRSELIELGLIPLASILGCEVVTPDPPPPQADAARKPVGIIDLAAERARRHPLRSPSSPFRQAA